VKKKSLLIFWFSTWKPETGIRFILFLWAWVCHGSDDYSPTSHRVGGSSMPGQSSWYLWSVKWPWTGLFRRTFVIVCQYHSANVPYSFICPWR